MDNTVLEATKFESLIQELHLMRNHETNKDKIFVIIEGIDDMKFYKRYFNDDKVVLYQTNNCIFVKKIVENLNASQLFTNRLFGIKDADFDKILNRTYPEIPNLFLTDYHDFEMMILSSEYDKYICSECGINKQEALTLKVAYDLKNLSFLRLYDEVQKTDFNANGINFKKISYATIYNGYSPVDMKICLDHVKSTCNNIALPHFPTSDQLNNFTSSFQNEDIKQLTRGHDLIHALICKLNYLSATNINLGYSDLCLALRCSYTKEMFEETNLYKSINEWTHNRNINIWAVA